MKSSKSMQYKKGDKVIIRANTCGHQFEIGDIVVITDVYSFDYRVKRADGDTWLVRDSEIEKYIPKSPCIPTPISALSTQIGGEHYKHFVIQPVEFCHANKLQGIESAVIWYVCRHRTKNGADDIKKAIHFLQILLELEYYDV